MIIKQPPPDRADLEDFARDCMAAPVTLRTRSGWEIEVWLTEAIASPPHKLKSLSIRGVSTGAPIRRAT